MINYSLFDSLKDSKCINHPEEYAIVICLNKDCWNQQKPFYCDDCTVIHKNAEHKCISLKLAFDDSLKLQIKERIEKMSLCSSQDRVEKMIDTIENFRKDLHQIIDLEFDNMKKIIKKEAIEILDEPVKSYTELYKGIDQQMKKLFATATNLANEDIARFCNEMNSYHQNFDIIIEEDIPNLEAIVNKECYKSKQDVEKMIVLLRKSIEDKFSLLNKTLVRKCKYDGCINLFRLYLTLNESLLK